MAKRLPAILLVSLFPIVAQDAPTSRPSEKHWAFLPVRRPVPPRVSPGGSQGQTCNNAIDHFILARLEENGLGFSPRATRETLIRRVTLDLIGLPPTPAEIQAFVHDESPCAFERLIDRLLDSPHYGERWGRHWLDLARFAESDGFEHDTTRPHAWRYRDYVIRSFNEDKPYDRFIREQLAGDELWPEDPRAVSATAFNLLGPDMVDSSDQVQRRHNTLNDMTDTTALVFLGLTLGCARCHDHKFEPFSQRDYFRLQAFFSSAKFDPERPIPTASEQSSHDAAMKQFNEHPTVRELAELEAPARKEIFERKVAALPPEAQAAHRTPPEHRNAEQANLVLETREKVAVSDADIHAALKEPGKSRRKALLEAIKKLPQPPPLPKTMALADGLPARTFVLHRGEYSQPREEVFPGFPAVLAGPSRPIEPKRSALADWIASPDHPLTARVMVNRIWRHHFGRGLVLTPSDFGTNGQPPSHPELLDWLASEFVARGWSVKQMHKLMLMSATYQQASEPDSRQTAKGMRVDPENRLYWRMNRIRLEGEAIRDALLAVSGQLNRSMGGPGIFPPIPKELFQGAAGWKASADPADHARRGIYIFARRNLRFPFLEVFDAPDSNSSCPARERSTTAPQSLTLLNSEEVMRASELTAKRLAKNPVGLEEQIEAAFELILNREPSRQERELSREFLAGSPLPELCRALFNLNEFVYVE